MNITCPRCSRTIPGENISVKDGFAQCDHCHSVYSLSELGQDRSGPTYSPHAYGQKPEVPMPKNIFKEQDFDGLTIKRKWFGLESMILIPFTLIWNGFIAVWITIAVNSGAYEMVAFASIHIAVGIFLLYSTLAKILNTTTIKVKPGELTIRHAPIPWKAPKPLEQHAARQFYGRERISRSRNGTSVRYELRVLTNEGSDIKLLTGFTKREQILYIEQEIERYWSITDEKVPGEMS